MQSADVTNEDAMGGQSDTPITAQPVEVVDETKLVALRVPPIPPPTPAHHLLHYFIDKYKLMNNSTIDPNPEESYDHANSY